MTRFTVQALAVMAVFLTTGTALIWAGLKLQRGTR